ncbi:MAG TPA: DUF3267 domain-containing protein [Ktedonobacteraceae bacterium]|nr:DUF3267 domain-containing protein [Ktedonobacteraceae bacterium]
MSLTYVDRFRPRLRHQRQHHIDAGWFHQRDEIALLEPGQLRPLAQMSLVMLIIGGLFFVALTVLAYFWHTGQFFPSITFWGVVLWIVANVVAYVIVLPLHECIHGMVMLLWGGRPYFGAKLPLALYCGARQQLFSRDHYLMVGIAPLIVISLLGVVATLYFPALASYGLLAWVGNFSGAAGDVMVVRRLLRLPKAVLVEDTETGYMAWEIAPGEASDRSFG